MQISSSSKVEIEHIDTSEYSVQEISEPCLFEDSLKLKGLVNVHELDSSIMVHLRYTTTNNFLHTDLYGCLKNAYLQKEVAAKLANASSILQGMDSSLRLLVWDAVRPRSIQWQMWNSLTMPFEERVKYVSNPKNGSVHNYGCAVDLTLCYEDGKILPMGTDFDHFGREANVRGEWQLLKEGLITKQQLENRQLLRLVMRKAGFTGLSSEWWHFNAYSRPYAKAKYSIIE